VCWSGFAVDVSGAGDGDDVVEGEGAGVVVWELHVDGMSAEPADGLFWVAF